MQIEGVFDAIETFWFLALKAIGAAKKAEEEEEIEVDKSCVGDIIRFFTAAHGF